MELIQAVDREHVKYLRVTAPGHCSQHPRCPKVSTLLSHYVGNYVLNLPAMLNTHSANGPLGLRWWAVVAMNMWFDYFLHSKRHPNPVSGPTEVRICIQN